MTSARCQERCQERCGVWWPRPEMGEMLRKKTSKKWATRKASRLFHTHVATTSGTHPPVGISYCNFRSSKSTRFITRYNKTIDMIIWWQKTGSDNPKYHLLGYTICYTYWHHIDIILTSYWHHIDIILTSYWHHIDIILTSYWHHIDLILTSYWHHIDIWTSPSNPTYPIHIRQATSGKSASVKIVASSMTPCTSAKPVRLLVESRAATAGDSTNRDFFLQKRRKKSLKRMDWMDLRWSNIVIKKPQTMSFI